KVLVPALDDAEGARRTAAAFALAASNDRAALAAVVARLSDDAARPDVVRALGLVDAPALRDALAPPLDDAPPAPRAAALNVLAFRGEAPPRAQLLRADDAPVLVAAALRMALLTGDRAAAPLARDALASADPAVRDAAIAAGLALGVPEAWSLCRKVV